MTYSVTGVAALSWASTQLAPQPEVSMVAADVPRASRARPTALTALALVSLALGACGFRTLRPTVHELGAVPPGAPGAFLKVHMISGELYLLDAWTVPREGEDLRGAGTRFDAHRTPIGSGSFSIPTAEMALLETNRAEHVSRLAMGGLTTFTVLYGAVTVACLADPKSCFGSCPTFYEMDDPHRPVAEGFSSSFARALEAEDLDDLGMRPAPGAFSLVMRNEALETHAVRRTRLRAVPAAGSVAALQTGDGDLLRASALLPPVGCAAGEGDCLGAVATVDDVEYASRTDSADLAVREELVVSFGRASGAMGLVLTARQSLVTTYVFYQSLAYAGSSAGELLAALERGEPGAEERALGVARELGGIEVFVSDSGGPWERAGSFDEAGPIAADRQVVPLGEVDSKELRVKLVMARGSWRIDELALAKLAGASTTVEIPLDSVTTASGADARAYARLSDPDVHLVTAPGDEYRLWFTIPDGGPYHVFLDAEGYYYEWMREPWLAEESPLATSTVLLQPREALRRMAPGFKEIEPEMERLFWASRFRRSDP